MSRDPVHRRDHTYAPCVLRPVAQLRVRSGVVQVKISLREKQGYQMCTSVSFALRTRSRKHNLSSVEIRAPVAYAEQIPPRPTTGVYCGGNSGIIDCFLSGFFGHRVPYGVLPQPAPCHQRGARMEAPESAYLFWRVAWCKLDGSGGKSAAHSTECNKCNMSHQYYTTFDALSRTAAEAYIRECTPLPHHYLLPPYQVNFDAFLTQSSLLSPPPVYMRGYGMPEYLWHCFEDWFTAPLAVRSLLTHYAVVGFRLRWPLLPIIVKSKGQMVWAAQRRQAEVPLTMYERIASLLCKWERQPACTRDGRGAAPSISLDSALLVRLDGRKNTRDDGS
ncbi:hypothetical protein PENSPDRAFT_672627 [Peniophora sp. CONT]|nr:hypothetical protein PENSPDRAFT_672627 [Peniophora sp. CONT]